MHTKPLEIECESLVLHELIKHELKVTKPTFDEEGADLLIIDNIAAQYTKYLKVQCKGRSLTSTNNVVIPKKYVADNFLVFLYIKLDNFQSSMYIFFSDDIQEWSYNSRRDTYTLNLNINTIDSEYFGKYKYDSLSSIKIKQLLSKAKVRKYSSLIIDEQFIELAIEKALDTYSKIHPDKNLSRPSMDGVIEGILAVYDIYQSKDSTVRCHVFSAKDLPNISYNLTVEDEIQVKVYREYANGPVCDDILEHINRTINAENVTLAADNHIYDAPLNKLHDKGVDIRLIQFATRDGREIFTKFYWGDVIYAVAKAMGLGRYEW
ncbi:hypothetical protein [Cycloclasticus pugetii]|uniref:hypothetical protein n=1 Tax=Cycloclasticus pugetii TaxID=34068 RepID=UPI003A8E723E